MFCNAKLYLTLPPNPAYLHRPVYPPVRPTDCDVNCHKKCEKLAANLCGVNQKLIVEALSSVRRGSSSTAQHTGLWPTLLALEPPPLLPRLFGSGDREESGVSKGIGSPGFWGQVARSHRRPDFEPSGCVQNIPCPRVCVCVSLCVFNHSFSPAARAGFSCTGARRARSRRKTPTRSAAKEKITTVRRNIGCAVCPAFDVRELRARHIFHFLGFCASPSPSHLCRHRIYRAKF